MGFFFLMWFWFWFDGPVGGARIYGVAVHWWMAWWWLYFLFYLLWTVLEAKGEREEKEDRVK